MTLRPRYSLLMLLVLTAFVAGGVKLWYGPHCVVERVEERGFILEREYTFIRDWRGDKVIHGIRIERCFFEPSKLYYIELKYVRHGVELDPHYYIFYSAWQDIDDIYSKSMTVSQQTETEEKDFFKAIEQERFFFQRYDDGLLWEGYLH